MDVSMNGTSEAPDLAEDAVEEAQSALVCDGNVVPTFDPCDRHLWPNGKIPYSFDSSVPLATRTGIRQAMDAWEDQTGGVITFTEEAWNTDRVIIKSDKNAAGIPGWDGQGSSVQWAHMSVAAAPHELGHVIGLSHEHQRYDRDRYVDFGFDAQTCSHYYHNALRCEQASPGSDFGEYDIDSAMQYRNDVNYPYYDKNGNFIDGAYQVTEQDGSDVREMYAYAKGWSKFVSLGRDVGAGQPLDTSIAPGVKIVGSPAVASQGSGFLDTYYRGSDNHIYHRYYTTSGGWSGYFDLGFASWSTDPAATSLGLGTAIVAAGYNKTVYVKEFAGGAWGGWVNLGSPAVASNACSAPALSSYGTSAQVFVLGCNQKIYYRNRISNGSWTSWAAVPGALPAGVTLVGKPAAASRSASVTDVFITTSTNKLYHTYFASNSWSGFWVSEASNLAPGSSPAVVGTSSNRVDVLFNGSDDTLRWLYWAGGSWSGPHPIGGIMMSSPAAVTSAANRVDVLAVGTDGARLRSLQL
jgi:hypothetical protein